MQQQLKTAFFKHTKVYLYRMARKKKYIIENIHIDRYAAEGKSIAKHQDKVIFVEGAIPGDIADLFVYKNKKDWAEARVQKLVTPAPHRIDPFCKHFGVCGGCKWQMLPYTHQLAYKDQQVQDQLQRIGKVLPEKVLPIAGAQTTSLYRNKLEFTFSNKQYLTTEQLQTDARFEKQVCGFHAPTFFDKVIDIEHCALQAEPTNAIRNFVKTYAIQKGYSFYDIRMHVGLLRTMMIRVCTTGEVLVNIVFGEANENAIADIMQAVHAQFPEITSLHYTVNLKMNDTIYDQNVIRYAGKDSINETLEQFTFKISPKSFFQTNTHQAEKLYQITREFAALDGTQNLYDLYCGTGSIGIFMSPLVKQVVGVEAVADAIADAKYNAAVNGLNNAHFYAGDVIDICNDEFFAKHGKADVVIIDPPRAGCHEKLLQKLMEIKAPIIVYVSCNPATQARDLQILSAMYAVTMSQAVDMFPHTHHVENVVQLKLK